jgi:hypothetical protein
MQRRADRLSLLPLSHLCSSAVKTLEEFLAWTDGIESYTRMKAPELYENHSLLTRWLNKHWDALLANLKSQKKGSTTVTSREIKQFMKRINLNMANRELRDVFRAVDS